MTTLRPNASVRLAAAPLLVLFVLFSLQADPASGQDWPSVISSLQRAGHHKRAQQLPTAYNNYAIELSKSGEWEQAAENLEKAVAMDRDNERFKKNLATIYLEHARAIRQQRQGSGYTTHRHAKRLAEKALQHDRELAAAHVLIGDIAYDNQDLQQAKVAWTKAGRLRPDLQVIQERIAKLDKEFAIERSFDRGGRGYFDIRYQNGIDPATASQLQQWLSTARTSVGNDFKYWPRHKLIVLVYSPEAFARIRSGPDWVAGVYDGKIRLPWDVGRLDAASVRPTLVHEYTHAIVHDLSRGRCPVWLNEGLAEFQEAKVRDPELSRLRMAVRLDQLIPLGALDAAFESPEIEVAALGYQQAFSVVTYLAQRHGFFRFGRTLKLLQEGSPIDEAFASELRVSPQQLERRWKQWLPNFVR